MGQPYSAEVLTGGGNNDTKAAHYSSRLRHWSEQRPGGSPFTGRASAHWRKSQRCHCQRRRREPEHVTDTARCHVAPGLRSLRSPHTLVAFTSISDWSASLPRMEKKKNSMFYVEAYLIHLANKKISLQCNSVFFFHCNLFTSSSNCFCFCAIFLRPCSPKLGAYFKIVSHIFHETITLFFIFGFAESFLHDTIMLSWCGRSTHETFFMQKMSCSAGDKQS